MAGTGRRLLGDRARHPAARAQRLRRLPAGARRGQSHADPDADGEAGRARRGRGPGARRRRLPAQAVQLRRARRPPAGADPPRHERSRRCARRWRSARRPAQAALLARAERGGPHGPGARPARRPGAARRRRGDEGRAAGRGVGLRLRRRRQHRRGVRAVPAHEARPAVRPQQHPDGAHHRLSPRRRPRSRRKRRHDRTDGCAGRAGPCECG